MRRLYSFVIQLLSLGFFIGRFFNTKLKRGYHGRKNQQVEALDRSIWIHCASHGEYEMIAPVIHKLKSRTRIPLVVTFFSPSGFEHSGAIKDVDFVYYMPLDLPSKVREFISRVNPCVVCFVKAEFWYNTLEVLKDKGIPYLLVSTTFSSNQFFFKPSYAFFRRGLQAADHIYTQDGGSLQVLRDNGFENASLGGNPRIDRVIDITKEEIGYDSIEAFKGDQKLLVIGSSWPKEEVMIAEIKDQLAEYKILFAPHNIDDARVSEITALFDNQEIAIYTRDNENADKLREAKILVLNKIGMLSSLYRYANLVVVSGGFKKKGLHNTLEPSVYHIPVIVGPEYDHFPEAKAMVELNVIKSINNSEELLSTIKLYENEAPRLEQARLAAKFFDENKGASDRIAQALLGYPKV